MGQGKISEVHSDDIVASDSHSRLGLCQTKMVPVVVTSSLPSEGTTPTRTLTGGDTGTETDNNWIKKR